MSLGRDKEETGSCQVKASDVFGSLFGVANASEEGEANNFLKPSAESAAAADNFLKPKTSSEASGNFLQAEKTPSESSLGQLFKGCEKKIAMCRDCRYFACNLFSSRCTLYNKATEASGDCDSFEERKAEK